MKVKILAVDDDSLAFVPYRAAANKAGVELITASSEEEAIDFIEGDPESFAMAIVDYQFKNSDGSISPLGVEIVKKIKRINPSIACVIVSGDESEESRRKWIGIVDGFEYKPCPSNKIHALMVMGVEEYKSNNKVLLGRSHELEQTAMLEKFGVVGRSDALVECVEKAKMYAKSGLPILITGETGTGKELFAKGIHRESGVESENYLPVNCADFKDDAQFLASELFGHKKGSFTGAEENKEGIFEAAKGGTVFLDEVHHLSESAQAQLLRALQEKKIKRKGENFERDIEFRLICAGKDHLQELVKSGQFSADLFFRINQLDLRIPPLRERKEDIMPLIAHVSSQYENPKSFSSAAYKHLTRYSWAGNVRELISVVNKLYVLNPELSVVRASDLPKEITSPKNNSLETLDSLEQRYEASKKLLILSALEQADNNVSKAALVLGVKRETLRDQIKSLRIKVENINELTSLKQRIRDDFNNASNSVLRNVSSLFN